MESRIQKIEEELRAIQARNARVEGDKAWEMSATRTAVLAVMTFVFTGVALYVIDSENAARNALIAALGYVLSTLSLSFLKRKWIAQYLERRKDIPEQFPKPVAPSHPEQSEASVVPDDSGHA